MAGNFESDCVAILVELATNGYRDLKSLAEATSLSKDECRRYLLEECLEERDVGELAVWKSHNLPLYWKVIDNVLYLGNGRMRINTSKRAYLEKYAIKYGFALAKIKEYPHVAVARNPTIEPDEVTHRKQQSEEISAGELFNERGRKKSVFMG